MPARHVADAPGASYLIENPTKHGRVTLSGMFHDHSSGSHPRPQSGRPPGNRLGREVPGEEASLPDLRNRLRQLWTRQPHLPDLQVERPVEDRLVKLTIHPPIDPINRLASNTAGMQSKDAMLR